MARSIDDSLNLLDNSLKGIDDSLVNKGVFSVHELKLSQVADRIRAVEVKKTGSIRIRQTVEPFDSYSVGFGTATYTINHSEGTTEIKVNGGTMSGYSNYVTAEKIPIGPFTITVSGYNTDRFEVLTSLKGTVTNKETVSFDVVFRHLRGNLIIKQGNDYTQRFASTKDIGTYTHTIVDSLNGSHSLTLTGNSSQTLQNLPAGTFRVTRGTNSEFVGQTVGTLNVVGNETTEIELLYRPQSVTIYLTLNITGFPSGGADKTYNFYMLGTHARGSLATAMTFTETKTQNKLTYTAPKDTYTLYTSSACITKVGTINAANTNQYVTFSFPYTASDTGNPEEPWFEGMSVDEPQTLEFTGDESLI